MDGRLASAPLGELPAEIQSELTRNHWSVIDARPGSATDSRLIDAQQKLQAMLERIRLPKDGPEALPLLLIDDLTPNAAVMATPFGKRAVIVTLGLLKLVESDDELAFVLGHELEHLTSDLQKVSTSLLTERVVELEVDAKSTLNRMLRQGYNPRAAYSAMNKLRKLDGGRVSETHVSSDVRQDSIEVLLTHESRNLGKPLPPDHERKRALVNSRLKSLFDDPNFMKERWRQFSRFEDQVRKDVVALTRPVWKPEELELAMEGPGRIFGDLQEGAALQKAKSRLADQVNRGLFELLKQDDHPVSLRAAIYREFRKTPGSEAPAGFAERFVRAAIGQPRIGGWGRDGAVWDLLQEAFRGLAPTERARRLREFSEKVFPEAIVESRDRIRLQRGLLSLMSSLSLTGEAEKAAIRGPFTDFARSLLSDPSRGEFRIRAIIEALDGSGLGARATLQELLDSSEVASNLRAGWLEAISGASEASLSERVEDYRTLKALGVELRGADRDLREHWLSGARTDAQKLLRELEWAAVFDDLPPSAIQERVERLARLPASENKFYSTFSYQKLRSLPGISVSREVALNASLHLQMPFGFKLELPPDENRWILDRLRERQHAVPKDSELLRETFLRVPREEGLSWVRSAQRREMRGGRAPSGALELVSTLGELYPTKSYSANITPDLYESFTAEFRSPAAQLRALFDLWDAQNRHASRKGLRDYAKVDQSQILSDFIMLSRERFAGGQLKTIPISDRVELLRRFLVTSEGEGVSRYTAHHWDSLITSLLDEAKKGELPSELLRDPRLVRSLSFSENQLRLARYQLEATDLSSLGRTGLPTQQIRNKTREISELVQKQFPAKGEVRDQLLDEIERRILATRAESEFLAKLRIDPQKWFNYPQIIAADAYRTLINRLNSQDERWSLIQYWLGVTDEPSRELLDRFESIAGRDGRGYLAATRKHFQSAGALARSLALQPLLDEAKGLLADPDSAREILKTILGDRYQDPLFRRILETYLESVPAEQRRLVYSHMLASVTGAGYLDGAPLSKILEGMGPLGIRIGQFLRSSGLVAPSLAKELDGLLDSAAPPNRAKIYEDLQKIFGRELIDVRAVNELVGSGTVNYVVQAEIRDPETRKPKQVVVRIQRDFVEGRAANEHEILAKAVRKLKESGVREELKLASAAEEALATAIGPLRGGGLDLDQSIERRQAPLAQEAYGRVPRNQADLTVEVAQPVRSIQKLVPEEFQSKVSVYEYVEATPFKELTARERRQVARTIVNSELEALFSRGIFDPDGHRGNWLYDRGRRRMVRIDYAQIRPLSEPGEKEAVREFVATLLQVRPDKESARRLAPLLGRIFGLEQVDSGRVTPERLEGILERIFTRKDLPSWKKPLERLYVLRSSLQEALAKSGTVLSLPLKENPRAAISGLAKLLGNQEELGSVRFGLALREHLDLELSKVFLSEAREVLGGGLKNAISSARDRCVRLFQLLSQ
ncbi:MAG: M48 family metalloprotease [Oligoflexia bacterium]|nr:M48 family metalloprotease [Oligoflexia bacterium]